MRRRRRALLNGAAPAASVLGLADDTAADGEDDGAELVARHALFRVVRSLVDHNGPLALIVDDLQWVDGASARWLAYLARRLGEAPVLTSSGLPAVTRWQAAANPRGSGFGAVGEPGR